jgi:hypothetical protein
MKTTEEIITPEKAAKYLATITSPEQQRKHVDSVSDGYARAMKSGHWMLTHQGIGFDDDGVMIDGQHRCWGIVKSGIPQRMMVTRGIPCAMPITMNGGEKMLHAIDCLDRGRPRSVADQLKLRHDVKNASQVVAISRSIAVLCAENRLTNTVPVTMMILDIFGNAITWAAANAARVTGFRISGVNATMALYIHYQKEQGMDFFNKVHYGESIKRGDASFALRDYLMKGKAYGGSAGGQGLTYAVARATAQCAMHHHRNSSVGIIKTTSSGLDWLMAVNKSDIAKLRKSLA